MAFTISRLQYITTIGCFIIISACLALIGWQFDIIALKSLVADATPINPVTALTFIVSGIYLILYARDEYPHLRYILSFIVTAVGLMHFIAYFIPGDNVRIDYLLYSEKIRSSHISNLIAPNTAFVFIFCGASMFTTTLRQKWILIARQVLIMLAFTLVYTSILGYVYRIQPAYRLGGFTPMALYTSLIFLLLNAGLFLTNIEYGISRIFASSLNGSRLVRKVFIFMIALPPLTGYLRLIGEKRGLYPTEFGVELHTIFFTIVVFVLITLYASLENKKQISSFKAERLLATSEHRFRVLFNSLKEGVASIDYQGKILYCNPSYCNILGYSEKELIGQVVVDMIIPLARRNEFYTRLEARKQGMEEDYETEIIKKSGDKIWINIKSRTLTNENGEAYAYLVSVNDITEQKVQIEDLKAFTVSAAHDLNAPLARMIMVISAFETGNLNEEQKDYLSLIEKTSLSMSELLQDLLDFSKIGAAQLPKAPTELDPIIKNVCATLRPPAFRGEIIIHPLPSVNGNEGAIKLLFTNLISNAIKYSSKKDHPLIEIGSDTKNGETVYYIKDNGVGLSGDQIKMLFTPFKRFHTGFEGNGIGLAIVKRIIEKHGGSIWVASTPGNGITFHFTLTPDLVATSPQK